MHLDIPGLLEPQLQLDWLKTDVHNQVKVLLAGTVTEQDTELPNKLATFEVRLAPLRIEDPHFRIGKCKNRMDNFSQIHHQVVQIPAYQWTNECDFVRPLKIINFDLSIAIFFRSTDQRAHLHMYNSNVTNTRKGLMQKLPISRIVQHSRIEESTHSTWSNEND